MPGPSNTDILIAIGQLQEGFTGVRRELDAASESRKGLYKAVEDQRKSIDDLGFVVTTNVQATSQLRDTVKALSDNQKTMADSVQPLLALKDDLPTLVDRWKGLKKTSDQIKWVIGLTGVSLIAFLYWFGETARLFILSWLHINPPPPGG